MQIITIFILLQSLLFSCKYPEDPSDVIEDSESSSWILNSFENIDQYKAFDNSSKADLRMLKNEYENLQIIIETSSNKELTIQRENINNPIHLMVRRVANFESVNDVLVPCSNTVKPERKLIQLWLTFKTDKDAKAGRYSEVIRFKNDEESYKITISIKIENAALPEQSSIASVFGINPNNLIYYGLNEEQKTEKKKQLADLLLSYRISPYFSTWLSGTMKTEVNSSPYNWNDTRTWDYLSDPRFNRIALPFHGLSDEELGTMLQTAKNHGLLSKAYFYLWDEPTKTSEYNEIRLYADKIHSYAPDAKVITTFYRGPEDGPHADDLFAVFDLLDGATSIFCTGVWSLQGNENRSQQCKAKLKTNQEWWTYVCMADYPGLSHNSSGIPNRAVMWRNWKEQSGGFLYWVVNGFSSMNPLRSRSELPKGDGLLVYPAEPFGAEGFCTSIRLERWREGAEDYEMLQLFEKKKGRGAAESLLYNVYKNPSQFTDNIKYMEAFRKNLIEGIIE